MRSEVDENEILQPDSKYAFKKFADCWGVIPRVDKILYKIVKEPSAMRIMLEKGVAALAGLIRLLKEGKIGRKEGVLLLITGSGLKDPLSSITLKDLDFTEIEPSLRSLEKSLSPDLL